MPTKSDVFSLIEKNYNYLNQMMVEEIDIASEHDGTSGHYREQMWMKFFRSIIPLKYAIAQGVIIIDSENQSSKEVDIAVYDESYTPYVFQYNTLKFIPIEAVVVAIECKSSSWKDNGLKDWAIKIRRLKPKASGIARMVNGYATGITNQTQQRSRPILILASNYNSVKNETLEGVKEKLGDYFDFIILKQSEPKSNMENGKFELLVKNEDKKLGWWGETLNQAQDINDKKPEGNVIDKNLNILSINLIVPPEKSENQTTEKEIKEPIKKNLEEFGELSFEYDSDKTKAISVQNKLSGLRIEQNPLLTLNLQLNQLLMLLNNPMLFPHFAYSQAFKNIIKEEK